MTAAARQGLNRNQVFSILFCRAVSFGLVAANIPLDRGSHFSRYSSSDPRVRMNLRIGFVAVAAALAVLRCTAGVEAAPYVLSNSPGDGTVTVGVEGRGAFGSAIGPDGTNAVYDPVGAGGPAGTSFESWVAIRIGSLTTGARTALTSGTFGSNPTVTGTPTTGTSSFAFSGLGFVLTQTLTPLMSGLSQTGSLLTQSYAITNTTSSAVTFELVRYLDGDLLFNGSIADGGGRLFSGPTEILFETDSATGSSTSTTFVGITAEGGTIPVANRFEIDSYSGLLSRILAGTALDNIVTDDSGDPDMFIDAGPGYDVTLALRNEFLLGAGASTTYTTTTIFGSGAPEDVPVGVVPEPTSLSLFLGAIGLVGCAWRRRRYLS
jgi:hypothetical protein